MGLDIVEVILIAEETFGIDIPHEDFCGPAPTAGHLHRVIVHRMRVTGRDPDEAEVMRRLVVILREQAPSDFTGEILPTTPLLRIFPNG